MNPMRIQLLMLIATFGLTACVTGEAPRMAAATTVPPHEIESGPAGIWTQRKLLNYPSHIYDHGSSGDVEPCAMASFGVKALLLQLGAHVTDIHVDACHLDGSEPTADATFSVLVPTDKTDASGTTVATRWQFHQWKGPLNCLEVAYVAQNVLPLFSTKDVQLFSKSDCRRNGVGLRVKILTLADSP
jgi:hypothetical protein